MSSTEEASMAIDKLNGSELGGREMVVNFPQQGRDATRRAPGSEGRAPRSFDRAPRASSANRVYVGNLSWGMDDMGLEDLFSEFGKVEEARIVMDRETGRSRGFGFVTMGDATGVANAVESLNGAEVDGRTLKVSLANERTGGGGGGGGGGGRGGGYGGGGGYNRGGGGGY
eukprot:SM000059S18661  [mRNA]  locus=s59:226301:226938:- [translate_table: standard]